MLKLTWIGVSGLVSVLIICLFWSLAVLSLRRDIHYPGELAGVMITLLTGLALSVVAAVKGSKWWVIAVALNLGTIIIVISRLH